MEQGHSEERIVLGFQGQGTHEIGMAEDILSFPEAQEVFDEADQVSEELTGSKITDIITNGPIEILSENSQLATFIVSAASTAVLLNRVKKRPFGVTGHSLGEYAALLAAGAFSLRSGIEMIHERQKAMNEADSQVPGGGAMAAVIGIDEAEMQELAEKLDIDVAAVNTGTSGTLSGPKPSVGKIPELINSVTKNNARATILDIKSAAHSRWNALAAHLMDPVLKDIEFHKPEFHFFANNGRIITDPDEIKAHLLRMFEDPVRFRDISTEMAKSGVKRFTEVGRRKLLSKFVARTVGPAIETELSSDLFESETDDH